MTMVEWMERLAIDSSLMDRHLNEKFSGGEKKRNEILQMAVLEPEMAILDETDTGLDIDALRIVATGPAGSAIRRGRNWACSPSPTSSASLTAGLEPDRVHVLMDGRITASGGPELADRLEREGYERYTS